MSAASDLDARATTFLAHRGELLLVVTSALNNRAQQLRRLSRSRAYSGPHNADVRISIRAEAKALDDVSALLWTPAGKGVIDHLADVVKAAAL